MSPAAFFESRGRVIEDFVLLEKAVDLHPRFESKEPAEAVHVQGEETRPICLGCQGFERRTRQILPLRIFLTLAQAQGFCSVVCGHGVLELQDTVL